MKRNIIIADHFYEDPDAVVEYAKAQTYILPYARGMAETDERATWRTSRYRKLGECPFKSSPALIEKLEFLTGEKVNRASWEKEFPVDSEGYPVFDYDFSQVPKVSAFWNCSFHVKHFKRQNGQHVHNHTDRDLTNAVGTHGWTGLVYLNRRGDLRGGLQFWRNKDPKRKYDWMTPPENWEMIDDLGNLYNRLILARGDIPHSGGNGWGNTVQNGRLFQTIFFRTEVPANIEPVKIRGLRLEEKPLVEMTEI